MLETGHLEGFSKGSYAIRGMVSVKKVRTDLTGKHGMTAGSKPNNL